jgi:hypothetical protein
MLVKLHQDGQKADRFVVDLNQQPAKVQLEESGEDVFLEWNSTVDDSGRLRKCVLCRGDVYRERTMPQITGFVIVLAFVGAVAGLLGIVTTWAMLIAMAIVLILDISILLLSFTRLVCYKCGTKYSKLDIAKYHQKWEPSKSTR